MAVEKAALDHSFPGMEECRKSLTEAVDKLENAIKAASKRAVRQRIRKATTKIEFDKIIVKPHQ